MCLVRGPSAEEAQGRLDALLASVAGDLPDAVRARCRAVWGDITHEGLTFGNDRERSALDKIDRVVHCAATVKFNLPVERARQTNVDGTRNVLRLAERLHRRGRLQRLDYIGTAFVAGTADGLVFEDDLHAAAEFRNTYERTKWEAERLVRVFQQDLPIAIFRPSVVWATPAPATPRTTGCSTGPIKVLATGAIRFAPADPKAIVDVVPVDYLVAAIDALGRDESSLGRCYHIAAGPEQQRSIEQLTKMAADFFGVSMPFLVPPNLLVSALKPLLYGALWGKRRNVFEKALSYFPYFTYRGSFDTSRTRAALAPLGIEPPSVESYFRNLLQYCVDTDWGRKKIAASERTSGGARPKPAARGNGNGRRSSSVLDVFTATMDPDDLENRDPKFITTVSARSTSSA
jgi:long-chain acyl-CoA synthetase